MPKNPVADVGCLIIDDPVSGESALSGLSLPAGLNAYPFDWRAGEGLLTALQSLLHRARSERGAAVVLARGRGCAAALALAEHLPVERLALVDPAFTRAREPAAWARPLNRLSAFARRNLSLCVSDALIVERDTGRIGRRLARALEAHCRVFRLEIPAESGPEMYTICEKTLNRAIFDFLRRGELPKDLAQNPEMCIIDG